VTTHNRTQLLRFLLGVSDHILCNVQRLSQNSLSIRTSRTILGSYHGKIVQFLEGSLEGLYVLGRQHGVIHQVGVDDIFVPGPGLQYFTRTPGRPGGFFGWWLLGTCKYKCFQHIAPGSRQPAVGGQMLTCAIRRSGIRGLDLFLATGVTFR
jgi:hypothetical protein